MGYYHREMGRAARPAPETLPHLEEDTLEEEARTTRREGIHSHSATEPLVAMLLLAKSSYLVGNPASTLCSPPRTETASQTGTTCAPSWSTSARMQDMELRCMLNKGVRSRSPRGGTWLGGLARSKATKKNEKP